MFLKSQGIFLFLLVLLIASSLVTSRTIFDNPSLVAYFFFTILSVFFIILGSFLYFKRKPDEGVNNLIPILLFALFTSYFFVKDIIVAKSEINIMHYYLLNNLLLLASLPIIILYIKVEIRQVFVVVSLVSGIEGVVCLLQFMSILKSQSSYFEVTGTWPNPNVTAMFLSLSFPAVFVLFLTSKGVLRRIYSILGLILLASIFLLKCRTAYFSLMLITGTILFKYFKLSHLVIKRFSIRNIVFLLVLTVVGIIALGTGLYKLKQNSADGRVLIWKVSIGMISKKSIQGYGLGKFEREYNLAQSEYFKSQSGSDTEKDTASFVNMAYNEYLQITVEGGVFALVLFLLFLLSLLLSKPLQPSLEFVALISGMLGFLVMAAMNFTIQAIPVMCLFVIYASLICIKGKAVIGYQFYHFSKFGRISVAFALLFFGANLGYHQIKCADAMIRSKSALTMAREGRFLDAENCFESFKRTLSFSEKYWNNYANILSQEKKFDQALSKYRNAIELTSNPDTYLRMANCYEKVHEISKAIESCQIAENMVPSRILPKYNLMRIYANVGDTSNAIKKAKEVISMEPKGASANAKYYQMEARKYLKEFKI